MGGGGVGDGVGDGMGAGGADPRAARTEEAQADCGPGGVAPIPHPS